MHIPENVRLLIAFTQAVPERPLCFHLVYYKDGRFCEFRDGTGSHCQTPAAWAKIPDLDNSQQFQWHKI